MSTLHPTPLSSELGTKKDSQDQILALTLRSKSFTPFKLSCLTICHREGFSSDRVWGLFGSYTTRTITSNS